MITLILCVLINILALKTKPENWFYYLMAFLADLVYGLTYAAGYVVNSTPWVMGVLVAIIGTYYLFHVAWNAWQKRRKK
jgi:threonine/homoserine/homoserine lactone efflux protein